MEGTTQDAVFLQLRDIHVAFAGIVALQRINLDVCQGELMGLVGPNGAGKSSLLNVINGVTRASAGRVILNGRDITRVSVHRRAGLGIGRSFQGVELFPTLGVVENLMIGRHHLMKTGVVSGGLFIGRARNEEIKQREQVERIIDFFELYPYRKEIVGSLPYGVQKLIGIARAVCGKPQLILLDEPASGLNREERENLARFILRIKHELRVTMVWVEHDVRMVADLADRITVLHYGEQIAVGTPDHVLATDEVRRAFLGVTDDQSTESAILAAIGTAGR